MHGADAVEAFVDVVDVDDRQPLLADLLHLDAAGDAGDDAVAAPAVGDRGALFVVARVDQQMPMGVLLGEVGDAADDAGRPSSFPFRSAPPPAGREIDRGRWLDSSWQRWSNGATECGVEWTSACLTSVRFGRANFYFNKKRTEFCAKKRYISPIFSVYTSRRRCGRAVGSGSAIREGSWHC